MSSKHLLPTLALPAVAEFLKISQQHTIHKLTPSAIRTYNPRTNSTIKVINDFLNATTDIKNLHIYTASNAS